MHNQNSRPGEGGAHYCAYILQRSEAGAYWNNVNIKLSWSLK